MRKVLFITNVPVPYRVDFFNEFAKLVDLTVCFERKGASDREESWIKTKGLNFNAIFLRGIKVSSDKAFCPSIHKIIKKGNYDSIIVSGYSSPTAMLAIKYLRKHNISYILSSDGGLIKDNGNGLKHKFKSHFIKGADGYLSTGSETDRYLSHYGADKSKIHHYPFTSLYAKDIFESPATAYEKLTLRRELGMPEHNRIVISVGRFIESKGFDVLIKSAKNLRENTTVYIVGGEPTDEYKKLIEENNVTKVNFVGFKSFAELVKYYRAADVFVLPTRTDVWGLVINEAMACGLPVVTTDKCVAGITLVKDSKNGFIVPIDDVSTLSDKINTLLSMSDDELSKAGNVSIETIKNYTFEKMAEKHAEIVS
ncbi:MAG: glycosyltransferase family 4 protein [Ruminococcaceae bacterium]|nr:glycosyltransferase family 4 protein [Oscillospiraceae bacterium]